MWKITVPLMDRTSTLSCVLFVETLDPGSPNLKVFGVAFLQQFLLEACATSTTDYTFSFILCMYTTSNSGGFDLHVKKNYIFQTKPIKLNLENSLSNTVTIQKHINLLYH